MDKIYNIIPGDIIEDDSIQTKINALIDSTKFDEWIEMNEKIYYLDFFNQNEKFYVMYLDPRGIVKRLYITDCNELVCFMKDRINLKKGEGLDIAICTKDFANAVICNHDGQIFSIKVSVSPTVTSVRNYSTGELLNRVME